MNEKALENIKKTVLNEIHDGSLTKKLVLLLEEYTKLLNQSQDEIEIPADGLYYDAFYMRDDWYDYNFVLEKLTKSNNPNSIKLYNFINTLVNRFNIFLSDEVMHTILSITKYQDDALYSKELTMSNIQALSYSCILNTLFRNEYTKDAMVFLNKILNNEVTEELEFNFLCYSLQDKLDRREYSRLNIVIEAYKDSFAKGNRELTLDNLRKINIGCDLIGVKFIRSETDVSFWDSNSRTVALSDYATNNVVYHEVGHFFDTFFGKRDYQVEGQILSRAKEHAISYPSFLTEIKEMNDLIRKSDPGKAYAEMLKELYGESDNVYTAYFNRIKIVIEELGIKGIEYLLSVNNISEKARRKVLSKINSIKIEQDKDRLIERLTGLFCTARIEDFIKRYHSTFPEFCFSDIVSAIFNGFDVNVNGETVQIVGGHTRDYFESYKGHYFGEIIANYNVLKVLGRDDLIGKIRELFGDEILEYLEMSYHEEKVNMKSGGKTNG